MNEIILTKEIQEKVEAAAAELLKQGVSEARVNSMQAAIQLNKLPTEGTFGTYFWDNKSSKNADFHHLRIPVQGGAKDEHCSISTLKVLGSVGSHDVVPVDGGFRLKIRAINEQFSTISQLALAIALEGRKFKAEPVEVKVREFEPRVQGQPAKQVTYTTAREAIDGSNVKQCYKITLVD